MTTAATYPNIYRTNTQAFFRKLGTADCIDAAIEYCCKKQPHKITTAKNVIKTLRDDVLKKKGFPNITAVTVNNLTELLNQPKHTPVQHIGKGKKAHTVGPSNYEYKDVLRYMIFNVLRSWTSIAVLHPEYQSGLTPSLRNEMTFSDSALKSLTEMTEEQLCKVFTYSSEDWSKLLSTISVCNDEEIDFILKIAIEKGSNLAKDIRLRKFLIDNTTGPNKTQLEEIDSKINPPKTDPITPKQQPTPADIVFVKGLFSNVPDTFHIQKRECGICWICGTPIYFYRIYYNSIYLDLCACGELEHVLPPGQGNIMGFLSSDAKIFRSRLTDPKDLLSKRSLRASHGLCNVIKGEMLFLIADITSGYQVDSPRIHAFTTKIASHLNDPAQLQVKNYELQFRNGNPSPKSAIVFITDMTTAITTTMQQIVNDASKIHVGNASQAAHYTVGAQLMIRTMVFGVIAWHSILTKGNEPNVSSYITAWKQLGGGSMSGGATMPPLIEAEIDTFISNMESEKCPSKLSFNKFNKSLNTIPDLTRKITESHNTQDAVSNLFASRPTSGLDNFGDNDNDNDNDNEFDVNRTQLNSQNSEPGNSDKSVFGDGVNEFSDNDNGNKSSRPLERTKPAVDVPSPRPPERATAAPTTSFQPSGMSNNGSHLPYMKMNKKKQIMSGNETTVPSEGPATAVAVVATPQRMKPRMKPKKNMSDNEDNGPATAVAVVATPRRMKPKKKTQNMSDNEGNGPPEIPATAVAVVAPPLQPPEIPATAMAVVAAPQPPTTTLWKYRHQNNYKKGIVGQNSRTRRHNVSVQKRKKKKEQNRITRSTINPPPSSSPPAPVAPAPVAPGASGWFKGKSTTFKRSPITSEHMQRGGGRNKKLNKNKTRKQCKRNAAIRPTKTRSAPSRLRRVLRRAHVTRKKAARTRY